MFSEVLGEEGLTFVGLHNFFAVCNGAQRCLNYLKHVSIVEKHRIEYLASIDGEERLYYTDFTFDADNKLLYDELQEQIKLVIGQLPDRCREVFLLRRFTHLQEQGVADKLQISTTAVEKHISKALPFLNVTSRISIR